jgi:tripartite-type tricarboxylate transporter receptor subunit TctC
VKHLIGLMSVLGLAGALASLPAAAQNAAFYRGKTVTLQVGFAPGGGYDVYARLVARFLPRFIPGHPNVVVQNVPGAGSLRLANLLYNAEPEDGTFIALLGREQLTAPLYQLDGVQFDATKFGWIGNLNQETSVCVAWHTAPFTRIEDARERQMAVGGTGPASITVILPIALDDLLGYRFKVIRGYPGGNDVILGLERGELQGRCGWSYSSLLSTRPDWVRDRKIRFLAVAAPERIPQLPNVPSVVELGKTDTQRKILTLLVADEVLARPLAAPPHTPPERLKILRAAFDAMVKDRAFLAAARQIGLDLDPMDWRELVRRLRRIYASSPSIVKAAKAVIDHAAQ